MRALLAVIALCACGMADESVHVSQSRKSDTQAGLSVTGDTQPQWYLVSESWCVNCPAAKVRFLTKGWPAENVLTIAEAKARFGITVSRIPYEFPEPGEPIAFTADGGKSVTMLSQTGQSGRFSFSSHPGSRVSSGCPGGVCPTSRPVRKVARGGRFFIWRR